MALLSKAELAAISRKTESGLVGEHSPPGRMVWEAAYLQDVPLLLAHAEALRRVVASLVDINVRLRLSALADPATPAEIRVWAEIREQDEVPLATVLQADKEE